jgi:hypothetical protein
VACILTSDFVALRGSQVHFVVVGGSTCGASGAEAPQNLRSLAERILAEGSAPLRLRSASGASGAEPQRRLPDGTAGHHG